jgi:hypothetical protein
VSLLRLNGPDVVLAATASGLVVALVLVLVLFLLRR